jgi:hypothetical protein
MMVVGGFSVESFVPSLWEGFLFDFFLHQNSLNSLRKLGLKIKKKLEFKCSFLYIFLNIFIFI